jgi:hypothetical protein
MKNIFKLSDSLIIKTSASLIGSPNVAPIAIPGTNVKIDPMAIMRNIVSVLGPELAKAGVNTVNVSSIPQSNVLGLAKYVPQKSSNGAYIDSDAKVIYVDVHKIFENYAKKPLSSIVQTDVNISQDPDLIKNFYMKVLQDIRGQLAMVTRHELEHKMRTLKNISENKPLSDNPEFDADRAGEQFSKSYISRAARSKMTIKGDGKTILE